ncbi:MAG: PD-(D/E)XK nuclease family protein, partial [Turicibacter sp.]
MSIRFILGRSGVGKTRYILNEIKTMCDEEPQGDPIFVIAPDQMTFHLEYQLLKQAKFPSLMRVQGVSFTRLSYRVLQETGGLVRHHLDGVGIALLLQKVMNEKQDDLSLFRYYANKPGFINKISEMISEFKSYQVTPDILNQLVSDETVTKSMSMQSIKKVKDISLLYKEFESLTTSKYLMSEDYYTLLMDSIASSEMISQSDFYIDGYHLLNKQEELILIQLMKYAKSVTMVFTQDVQSELSYYEMPTRTINRLKELMEKENLSYDSHELTPPLYRFNNGKA